MAAARPFRDKMFLLATRTHLTTKLVREHEFSRSEARELAQSITDATIEEAAKTVTAGAAAPAVGAGGFLAFLLAFIQSPLFAQLLEMLLSLFAGGPVMQAPTPPSA